MIKIDLITGFLGSGKTTLLKKYLQYLINKHERVCVLEFDYGAVNVDMMLLQEFNDKCDLEMIAGGSNYDIFVRRFKTKLISIGMRHYDRVIIEPSGIFDPSVLFDVINEEPLSNWFKMNSIVAVVDSQNLKFSHESELLFVNQLSYAGLIYLSKCSDASNESIKLITNYVNNIAQKYNFSINRKQILNQEIENLKNEDYLKIESCSYFEQGLPFFSLLANNNYQSIYILDKKLSINKISDLVYILFNDKSYGNILRIKGFINEDNKWFELNQTHAGKSLKEINNGQDVIIIIGENLNENKINSLF